MSRVGFGGREGLRNDRFQLGPRWRLQEGRESVVFSLHTRLGTGSSDCPRIEIFEPGQAHPITSIQLELTEAPPPFELWQAEWEPVLERFEYLVRCGATGAAVLDPYAPALSGGEHWGRSESRYGPQVGRSYRGLLVRDWFDPDWLDCERAPRPHPRSRVICELHVRGFTVHPSSGVPHPGTYLGLIEKIPYLLELGVTTVELLPVFEFDETDNPRKNPFSGERLWNVWGYAPVSFFAPKAAYAASHERGAAVHELRLLVEELHRAGLEVVLDVVYNHTGEHPEDPVSWLGLDRDAYYLVAPHTGKLLDFSGCGNTFHVEHQVARQLVLDSLRHWVRWYNVDGFRFDLAGAFFRSSLGEPLGRSSLIEAITGDSFLQDRLLVAEPWDVTGFFPKNGFPSSWKLWNGPFRDDVRRLVRGESVSSERIAEHLGCGSAALTGRAPRYVDFVSCHDGFPVADLVVYARKHNEENGEGNRDGSSWNFSSNYGQEGPTDDPELETLRGQQRRNLLALWAFSSSDTVLFPAGDEGGRTQGGNNNPWCQDNERGWVVWERLDPVQIHWFRQLLSVRRQWVRSPGVSVAILGVWKDRTVATAGDLGKTLPAAGLLWRDRKGRAQLFCAWNFSLEPIELPVPKLQPTRRWVLRLDTSVTEREGIRLMRRGVPQGEEVALFLPSRSVRLWRAQPAKNPESRTKAARPRFKVRVPRGT